MARDGSGTYNLPAGQPVSTGTVIDSTVFNTLTADLKSTLTASIAKDGQTTPTGNLPMGGFKHTGVADATVRTQYATAGQSQDGGLLTLSAVAGADTITASLNPAITAYISGQRFTFLPASTNTTAATLNVNGIAAKSIVKGAAGIALVAGDLTAGVPATVVYNGTSFYLQNTLDTGISPTWTGTHVFSKAAETITLNSSTATNAAMFLFNLNSVNKARIGTEGTAGATITGSAIGDAFIWSGTGIAFSANSGGNQLRLENNGQLSHGDGAVGTPSITFLSDTNTGFYRAGADDFVVSVGGAPATQWLLNGGIAQTAFADGTAGIPGLAFNNDLDTGVYRAGANTMGFVTGGVLRMGIDTASIGPTLPILGTDGLVGAPAYSFNNDPDTGFWRAGSGDIAASGNGVEILRIRTDGLYPRFGVLNSDGLVGTPSYSFNNDPNTGWYSIGADSIGLATGGALRLRVTTGAISTFVAIDAQAPIQGADGSVGAPEYSFSSDGTTGFYRTASGDVSFSAANSRVFRMLPAASGGAQVADSAGTLQTVGYRQIPRSTTATTLVAADLAKCVAITAAIAIPASVFSAGDAITIYNDSAGALNITIAAGTLRLAGTATTGARSLAARGFATLWFNVGGATPEVIASGNVT